VKKLISLFLSLVLMLGILAGCGKTPAADDNKDTDGKKLSIVATIFPAYDWVRQILGERASDVDLTLLLDNGADLHSFQPTADDMVKIANCDMFIYVGGESDEWVEDALSNASNKSMVVVNLMDVLGDSVKEEEVVEGMQAEHEHENGDGHDEHEHHHDEEEKEYDEHVWLSLKNAAVLCAELANQLSQLDADHQEMYASNATEYIEKLSTLDVKYQEAAAAAKVKTVLFGDRFPFRYLVDDYGLSYYAAFVGCSAETEASFETIIFLAKKVDELELNTVLTIESGDGKIARTIIENTAAKSAQVLQMDSMQSTTAQDVEIGATYLGVMEKNLDVLKETLK